MFERLNTLSKQLQRNISLTKYGFLCLIFLLAYVLCGQLIAQMIPVSMLNKVTGRVESTEVKLAGYTSGGKYRAGSPLYALAITLDDHKTYNVDLDIRNYEIRYILQKGSKITIYYPTMLYQILSLDGLDFGSRVSQVELGNNVLTGFADHKSDAWSFIFFNAVFLGIFYFKFYRWNKSIQTLKS